VAESDRAIEEALRAAIRMALFSMKARREGLMDLSFSKSVNAVIRLSDVIGISCLNGW
jgi:hypothetical protein